MTGWMAIDFGRFEVLTFDCYGTLIDWETGILSALKPILAAHGAQPLSDDQILEHYARFEAGAQEGKYLPYREVLRRVVREFGAKFGFQPTGEEAESLPGSLQAWKPFPDTVEALKLLAKRFRLAVISNVDDDLFDHSAKQLGTGFEWVTTSQQARSYKPSPSCFQAALARIGGARERVLHVAASLYHDVIPAKGLGWAVAWVNRKGIKRAPGAAPTTLAEPDLEVPDLRALAALAAPEGGRPVTQRIRNG
jgi:2-haloacid dehalogenase